MNPDLIPVLHQGNLMSRNHIDGAGAADLFNQGNDLNRLIMESQNSVMADITQSEVTMINEPVVEKQLNSYL
jgi:hypothetical protein